MIVIINIQKEVADSDKGQDFFDEIKEKLGDLPDTTMKAVCVVNEKLE